MISPIHILAQDGASSSSAASGTSVAGVIDSLNILFRPDELMDQLSRLPFMWAAVIVTVGILCVFNGYRWHKWVVAVLAFLCGLGLGYMLSREMGKPTIVATSFGCLCAIVATPLLRIVVAIFGGITGAFIGANAWTAVEAGSATDTHWAGAVIGFIVVAMLSIIFFRLVVVLFTSVGGAIMCICGGITLLMNVPTWETAVRDSLSTNQMLIPMLLALGAVSGFVIQESRLRSKGVSIVAKEAKAEST